MNWIIKNKVLVIGMLSAILLAISELVKGGESSTTVLILSGLIAAASWLARNIRGQWASIAGLFGNALLAYLGQMQEGGIHITQIIFDAILGFLAIVSPPAKSIGYEKSETIMEAKNEGELIQPTPAEPNPPTQL